MFFGDAPRPQWHATHPGVRCEEAETPLYLERCRGLGISWKMPWISYLWNIHRNIYKYLLVYLYPTYIVMEYLGMWFYLNLWIIDLYIYIHIPYKSKTEVFLGFAQIPGVYTHKTRGFPKPYNFWSLIVVFPHFFWQNSPFLYVRHSWPWVGWHNHACYPIQIPNGDVFSADAPSQITFKPLKIQWNLNHLNPYKSTG